MENKKAQTALPELITFVVLALAIVLIIGTYMYVFGIVSDELNDANIVNGDVNISNYSRLTIGQVHTGLVNGGDIIGILFLFGVILAIMFSGYLNREQTIPIFFMVDFVILIFAYILATYISNSYETILAILPFSDTIANNLSNSSRFLLLLPSITVVTGAITMILSYGGFPSRSNGPEVAGF